MNANKEMNKRIQSMKDDKKMISHQKLRTDEMKSCKNKG